MQHSHRGLVQDRPIYSQYILVDFRVDLRLLYLLFIVICVCRCLVVIYMS